MRVGGVSEHTLKELRALNDDLGGLSGVLVDGLLDRLEAALELEQYTEHQGSCVWKFWQAGEPREDGYYTKFKGEWYKQDSLPACGCGLDDVRDKLVIEDA